MYKKVIQFLIKLHIICCVPPPYKALCYIAGMKWRNGKEAPF